MVQFADSANSLTCLFRRWKFIVGGTGLQLNKIEQKIEQIARQAQQMMLRAMRTLRDLFQILLNQTEIRLY